MKVCPNCNNNVADEAVFCTVCGTAFAQQTPPQGNQQVPPQQPYTQAPYYAPPMQPVKDPYDHTDEFDPKDISDNKVISMLVYLLGVVGIIIALIGSYKSEYATFHVRQGMKFAVVNTLIGIISVLLSWTFIVPIVGAIALIVLFIIRIICFVDVCSGKAKEPAIIRELKFLK